MASPQPTIVSLQSTARNTRPVSDCASIEHDDDSNDDRDVDSPAGEVDDLRVEVRSRALGLLFRFRQPEDINFWAAG